MLRPFQVTLTKTFQVNVLAHDLDELREMLDEETPIGLDQEWDEPLAWAYTVEDPVGTAQTFEELPDKLQFDLFVHEKQALPRRLLPDWLGRDAEADFKAQRTKLGLKGSNLTLPGIV